MLINQYRAFWGHPVYSELMF